ncbi:MAG: hypothetical protein HY727_21485 [Candidatus Rokubacteria bacterium]|nr:hypothetical protein [Candidatus Rokubacteria bacterium]
MAQVLHLLKGGDPALALATIAEQCGAGDRVVAVFGEGQVPCALPGGVTTRRLGHDLSYAQLLDLVFEADQVIAW